MQRKANFTGTFSSDNAADQLDGIVIDVGKAMMAQLNISYTITLDPSGSYGAKQPNGQWSGMMLKIMNGVSQSSLEENTAFVRQTSFYELQTSISAF